MQTAADQERQRESVATEPHTALRPETAAPDGTPTFFINGERHDGGYELPALLAALQAAGAS